MHLADVITAKVWAFCSANKLRSMFLITVSVNMDSNV